MFEALKASCALPLLYRRRIHLRGERLLDGGVSDPIPAEEAHRRGARKILVIRSRPAGYVKRHGWSSRLGAFLLRGEPAVAEAVNQTASSYARAMDFILSPPAGCHVVQVAPRASLSTKRTSQDRKALERDYALGREAGEEGIRNWVASP